MARFAVLARFQIEGFHCWPEAPEVVSFLRQRHRHLFHVELEQWVTHTDRDVEIIMLRRRGIEVLASEFGYPCEFRRYSCEQIAEYLLRHLQLSRCTVLEDNENGATAYDVHPS
jgi:hypothetical protein